MAQRIKSFKFHRKFKKNYRKRIVPHPSLVKKFEERFKLFLVDSSNPSLRDHKLSGELKGYRSFSVTGDIRVLYQETAPGNVEIYDIGSHNQIYE